VKIIISFLIYPSQFDLITQKKKLYLHYIMVIALQVLFVLGVIVLLILFVFRISRAKKPSHLPENYSELLTEYVKFYRQLDIKGKEMFDKRVEHFFICSENNRGKCDR
jgi:hypothetical protein